VVLQPQQRFMTAKLAPHGNDPTGHGISLLH
jgi:hypothetical protein